MKIIVIVGPTAVGKSDLAVRLAKKFNGEVISADSRQVYRGLNIGTGKITKQEMEGVPHHLLNIADPKKQFSAGDFTRLGREKIAEIFSRGKTPIICGGTGFYIAALLGEMTLAKTPPNFKLRQKLQKKSPDALFAILKKLAPARTAIIDRHNPRRLIRAIEVAISKDKNVEKIRHTLTLSDSNGLVYEVIKIGLTLPPEKLRRKISIRLFSRISRGMIAEAKKLHRQGLSWKRMEELGLEYRYFARYLQKKISKEEMIERLQTEIRHYAKRQMTWFKRDKQIKWFAPSNPKSKTEIEKAVLKFLKPRK